MYKCIEQAKIGDPIAKRALVDALTPRLKSMATYYARRTGADADDLLQEAWIGLLEALPGIDMSIGSPEQYLIQRARWKLLDDIKRSNVRKCAPLEDAHLELLSDDKPGGQISEIAVSEFMSHLSDSHQKLVVCLVGGMTWREAGAVMGCSSANVAYHMRQIRKRFEHWQAGKLGKRETIKDITRRPLAPMSRNATMLVESRNKTAA